MASSTGFFRTTAKVKGFFLDRAHVLARIGAAKAKVLKRSGGRIRITAQRSMRYRKKGSSAPGKPPFAHKERGALLRKLLFFAYDPGSDSVVVGPVGVGRAQAPSVEEFGGTVKRARRGKVQTIVYPQRPYMEPALRVEEPRLPSEWSGSVVGP